MPRKMKMEEKKKVWAIQEYCSTMLMVFWTLEMSMDSNWSELEILGLMENGVVNLLMKTKLGMTTKVLKKNWTMFLETMEHGGWDMKIGVLITIRCTFARFSHLNGDSSLSLANGKATLLVDLILQWLIETKKRKTMCQMILMIDGSITLSLDWQSIRRLKSLFLLCKKMKRSLRDHTFQ